MSDHPASLPPEAYADWLADLKSRIHYAQQRATLAVNRELVLLYGHIGRDILTRQAEAGWGAKVIERLAHDLRRAFPDMKGFSPRNLKYMRAFAEALPDAEFVQEMLAQLPWYHQLALLDKLPGPETRLLKRSGTVVTNFDARRIRLGRQDPAHGRCRIQATRSPATRVANQPAQHRTDRVRAVGWRTEH